jgi:hypothetical protein
MGDWYGLTAGLGLGRMYRFPGWLSSEASFMERSPGFYGADGKGSYIIE